MEHVGLCNFRSLHWRHVYHKRSIGAGRHGHEHAQTLSHTDREVHAHPHESYQRVHWHASAKFTLINATLLGCGRCGRCVSLHGAGNPNLHSPDRHPVCLHRIPAHAGHIVASVCSFGCERAPGSKPPSYSQFSSLAVRWHMVKFQPGGTRNNAKRCGLMLPTNTHPESTGQPSKSRLNFSRHMW